MMNASQAVNAIQSAFIACAPRMVPASFRIAETFHPELKRSKVVMSPEVVAKRELVTLGLTWFFAFITNFLINYVSANKDPKREKLIIFLSAVIGSAIAELVARKFAYRSIFEQQRKLPAEEKTSLISKGPQTYLLAIRNQILPSSKKWIG